APCRKSAAPSKPPRPRALEREIVLRGAKPVRGGVVALVHDEEEFVARAHRPLHAEVRAEFVRKIVVLRQQAQLQVGTERVDGFRPANAKIESALRQPDLAEIVAQGEFGMRGRPPAGVDLVAALRAAVESSTTKIETEIDRTRAGRARDEPRRVPAILAGR